VAGRTKIEPRLRAEFKELARDLVACDREAKRNQRSQNTIGEIERALVRAFLLGRELGASAYMPDRPAELGIDWEEVPPRGRETLSSMTYRNKAFEVMNPVGLRRGTASGRDRWSHIYTDGRLSSHSVAAGSVNSLVALGLLAASEEDGDTLALTAKGRATCEAYWRRFNECDPSLPRESWRR
jgi:hypothetical protein